MSTRRKHSSLDVGRALRHHRTSRDMTQAEFGALVCVSWQQIQKYEKGVNRLAADKAANLAAALNITVDELLGVNGFDGLVTVSRKPVKQKTARKFKPRM